MAAITIIGTGYVGLVSGSCLADFGNNVICVDNDIKKIAALKAGQIPIFEAGLDSIVGKNLKSGRLTFETDFENAVKKSEVVFIAVGTPPKEDGGADLSYVENVARQIGNVLNSYKVIVDKSTVPVGTGKKVKKWITEELVKRNAEIQFDVVSNPEFLREGAAIADFMHPDRIVIGAESEKAKDTMKGVYRALYLGETPYIETNIESAEMIKYASNAFLAVKIAFINETANLCEKVGANVQDVAKAMGRDGRIGGKFLHPGPGYGGSCFPKDTKAYAKIGTDYKNPLSIVEATIKSNEAQKDLMVEKIKIGLGEKLIDKTIAVLGLAFKPNTDDMREAPALHIVTKLAKLGAQINACDPAALNEAKWRFESIKDKIKFFENEYDAIKDSDAVVIMTEWNQYRNLDIDKIKNLMCPHHTPLFFDLRNVYKRKDIEQKGLVYFAVGQ